MDVNDILIIIGAVFAGLAALSILSLIVWAAAAKFLFKSVNKDFDKKFKDREL